MKTNESLLAERKKHIPQGPFNTHPIFAQKAEGALITDVEGKEYIDFAGGIGVANAGHCDAVLEQFEKKGLLQQHSIVGDVRGLGAMVGMELVVDRRTKELATASAKQLVARCREKGLLMISAGTHSNIIRPLMPLVITDEKLERGLSIIDESLTELTP